jgi:hypothetical protein
VTLQRASQHVLFRALVALLFLAIHLGAITRFASVHFGLPWNLAPGDPPAYEVPDLAIGASNWNRLPVSRWDSGQYIQMSLDDIYSHCPKADLRGSDLPSITTCNLAFYPAYSILGWVASLGGTLPVDYALLGVSLMASFLLLFLWTGPVVVHALGLWGTYCSLLLFNVFTTGFTLVTILSEPCAMLFVFAAFVCLEKRRFVFAAVLAGAASGVRVTGVSASVGFVAALLVWAWDEEELSPKEWLRTVALIPLSAWGLLSMMLYQWWRFRDPFIYAHAHAQAFEHTPRLAHLFWPEPAWIMRSLGSGVQDVAVAALMTLWFALGHRGGLGKFSRSSQVYWYAEFLVALCLPLYGSAELGYGGVTRYMLMLFGAFFAMASILKNKPVALAVWCTISLWHYWHSDLCFFEQHMQIGGMDQCLVDVRNDSTTPTSPSTPLPMKQYRFRNEREH